MRVNVGCRELGIEYKPIKKTHVDMLKHYIDNVAPKYSGDFVEENKAFAKDILSGKKLVKYASLAGAVIFGSLALLGMMAGDPVSANAVIEVSGHIDTSPLDRFFKEIYWTMFKVLMYIATPVWAWVGYILATGGANSEKRTQAKKVATGLVIGTAITASAPWASGQLFRLWTIVF